jgi:hypothetical protein
MDFSDPNPFTPNNKPVMILCFLRELRLSFFPFFPAASLLLSCISYRIAARKQQGCISKSVGVQSGFVSYA